MDRNPEQERMFYIRGLQNHLISALFTDAEKKLDKAIWKVAGENQRLLGGNVTPTFIFNGRWYPIFKPVDPTACNKILHPSLRKKVYDLLNQLDFNDRDIRVGIETLIGNVLTVAKNAEDLERLLPEAIMTIMPRIDRKVFDIENPLPEKTIQKVLKLNETNMRYFKRMLMIQLLLSKI